MSQPHDYSHAESADLACRACGAPVPAEVWVIVDVAARPDLLARLRAGTLHELTCPACGHTATVNAPLLILRPAAEPPLLFSPATGDQRERDEEQAASLLGMLRAHMGAAWREEWLGRGLVGAHRASLPALLGDDPATAARLAQAAAGEDDVPPALRAALAEILAALQAEGVRVNTSDDLRRALDERPMLKARLSDAFRATNNE